MKSKKIVACALLLALCVAVLGFIGVTQVAKAAASTTAVFTTKTNSKVEISTDGGLSVTFAETANKGSITSVNKIDLNKYAIKFKVDKCNFSTLYFSFASEKNNADGKGFVVTFAPDGSNTVVKVYDTLTFVDVEEGTEKVKVTLTGIDMTANYIWLEYVSGILQVRSIPLSSAGDTNYTAYTVLAVNKNTDYSDESATKVDFSWVEDAVGDILPYREAEVLEVGVLGQKPADEESGEEGASLSNDSVINILSVSNYYGEQVLGTDEMTVRPIIKCSVKNYRGMIIGNASGEDIFANDLIFKTNGMFNEAFINGDLTVNRVAERTAAEGTNYYLPFYVIALQDSTAQTTDSALEEGETKDLVNFNNAFDDIKLFVRTADEKEAGKDFTEKDFTKTSKSYTLSTGIGTEYVFVFYVKIDNEGTIKTFALRVTSIEDEVKPEVDGSAFVKWAQENLSEYFGAVIVASESGSDTLPTISKEDNETYNIVKDYVTKNGTDPEDWEVNDFENLDIVVGIKRADATDDYEWQGDTSINYNDVGEFTIAYKVVDQSGNETIIGAFTVYIDDVTAPTISISSSYQIMKLEVEKVLEVPAQGVSRSDNCSGVNTSLNTYTVYVLDYERYGEDGYNVDNDGYLITEGLTVITKAQVEEGYTLTDAMISKDADGNARPTFIVVYEATDNAGNHTVGKTFGFVTVTVKSATAVAENPVNETLEIFLIVLVAVLVVAILVLFFVNPQQKKQDARMAAVVANEQAKQAEEKKEADKKENGTDKE